METLARDLATSRAFGSGVIVAEGRSLNVVLARLASSLVDPRGAGVTVPRRGSDVREFRGVAVAVIGDPDQNLATITGRRLNPWATLAEFPWIMAGRTDIAWLGHYLPKAADFSDDGVSWRAGYGGRFRYWGKDRDSYGRETLDQLATALMKLRDDPYTRQAVVGVWDPDADLEAVSKDIPCTLSLKFEISPDTGALDLTVFMRSNDLIWGFSGVNVTNFTLLQRLFGAILERPVGKYTHVAANLHVYRRHFDMLEGIAEGTDPTPTDLEVVGFGPWGGGPPYLPSFTRQCRTALEKLTDFRQRRAEGFWPNEAPSVDEWRRHLDPDGDDADGWLTYWCYFMALYEYRGTFSGSEWLRALEELPDHSWALAAATYLVRQDVSLRPILTVLARKYAHPNAYHAVVEEALEASIPTPKFGG